MKRQVTLCVLVFALLLTCANAMAAAKISNATAESGSGATISDKDEDGKSFDGKAFMVTYDGQKNKEYVVMVVPSDIGVPTAETINSTQDGLSVMAYMNQVKCDASDEKVNFTVRPNLSKAENGQEFSVYITSDETSGSAAKKIGSFTIDDLIDLLGDVNGDGEVTVKDRAYLTRYLANWDGYSVDINVGDLNKDGEVTVKDRAILTRYLANWEGYTTLPYTS